MVPHLAVDHLGLIFIELERHDREWLQYPTAQRYRQHMKIGPDDIKRGYIRYCIMFQSYFSIRFDPLEILKCHLVATLYGIGLGIHRAAMVPVKCCLVLAGAEEYRAQ